MENLIDKWGAIPLKDLKNEELNNFVNAEDISMLHFLLQPVNPIIGVQGDYVILKIDNTHSIRLNSAIVQNAQEPDYFVGDKVKMLNSKGVLEYGEIKDFYWHVKDNKYIYLLEVNGKMKSRRYYVEDLESNE